MLPLRPSGCGTSSSSRWQGYARKARVRAGLVGMGTGYVTLAAIRLPSPLTCAGKLSGHGKYVCPANAFLKTSAPFA